MSVYVSEWLSGGACSQIQALKNQGTTKKRRAQGNFYWRGTGSYQTGTAEVGRLSHGEESFWYRNYKTTGDRGGDTGKENKELK